MILLRPRAVLDANVVVPAPLRDTLFRAAHQGLYDVRLSADILEEMRRTLVGKQFASAALAQRLVTTIHGSFPRSIVTGYDQLVDQMPNDVGDRHVLAAAVHCNADAIVTMNLRHFSEQLVRPLNVEIVSPDIFLLRLFEDHERLMIEILSRQAADLQSPPMSVFDVLERLRQQAPTFADNVMRRLNE